MLKINTKQKENIVMPVKVEGNLPDTVSMRFVLVGEQFEISFPVELDEKEARVEIPVLKGILFEDECEARVEMFNKGKHSVLWEDKAEIERDKLSEEFIISIDDVILEKKKDKISSVFDEE